MEYTIKRLASLSGVSTRTLRYYDEINLLKPLRINSSGYRIYGQNEIKMLQQILFYRELSISLDSIKDIMLSPAFDELTALKSHYERLIEKKEQLNLLINNVEKTIDSIEGKIIMNDNEKFQGFKKSMIDENEKKYGKEIREKYGKEAVDSSNKKLMNMSSEEYNYANELSSKIIETLKEAYKTSDCTSPLALETAKLHQEWIKLYWNSYSKEAHAGLVRMYVEDDRFKAYYDKEQDGLAEFLRDSVLYYLSLSE